MLKKKWMWIIVLIYTGLIFNNSLKSGEVSGGLSASITKVVFNFLLSLKIQVSFSSLHHFIRKLAHFSEFFLLSVFVQIAVKFQPLLKNRNLNILLFMLIVPCIDETIQLFVPGRAGLLQDALLDMSGFALAWLIGGEIAHIRKNRT